MALAVVDLLEMIDVEQRDRQRGARVGRTGKRFGAALGRAAAIGYPRQPVLRGQGLQRALVAAAVPEEQAEQQDQRGARAGDQVETLPFVMRPFVLEGDLAIQRLVAIDLPVDLDLRPQARGFARPRCFGFLAIAGDIVAQIGIGLLVAAEPGIGIAARLVGGRGAHGSAGGAAQQHVAERDGLVIVFEAQRDPGAERDQARLRDRLGAEQSLGIVACPLRLGEAIERDVGLAQGQRGKGGEVIVADRPGQIVGPIEIGQGAGKVLLADQDHAAAKGDRGALEGEAILVRPAPALIEQALRLVVIAGAHDRIGQVDGDLGALRLQALLHRHAIGIAHQAQAFGRLLAEIAERRPRADIGDRTGLDEAARGLDPLPDGRDRRRARLAVSKLREQFDMRRVARVGREAKPRLGGADLLGIHFERAVGQRLRRIEPCAIDPAEGGLRESLVDLLEHPGRVAEDGGLQIGHDRRRTGTAHRPGRAGCREQSCTDPAENRCPKQCRAHGWSPSPMR